MSAPVSDFDERVDLDLPFIQYGNVGKFGEFSLFPGKDLSWAMVNQRFPLFYSRMINYYVGSLYGFQDRFNRFTKLRFVGRRYNVNGINSMGPEQYQSMNSACYAPSLLPLASMKCAQCGSDAGNVNFSKCELDDRYLKTSPKIEYAYLPCTHNGLDDLVKVFDVRDKDWTTVQHIDQYQLPGIKQLEDGGCCTKRKSPGHVWLED